jgi:GNAT superfamily N-acetyltransferase
MQDSYRLLAGFPQGPRRLNLRVFEITSGGDRRRFARLPWRIYRRDRRWVPPLLRERSASLTAERNPALAGAEMALFLAEAANLGLGDEVVGTIAVWVEPDRNSAWFTALEAINEPEVVTSLLEAAETWATEHLPTAVALCGPACLDPRGAPGLLVDGFDRWPPAHLPYNAPYLLELVETAGYTPVAAEWQTYELPLVDGTWPERAETPAGLTVRPAEAGNWSEDRALLADIYEAVQAGVAPGATILEDAPGWRLDPRLAFFIEVDERAVGAIAALTDMSAMLRLVNGRWIPFGWLAEQAAGRWLRHRLPRRLTRLRVLPPAVLPEWRARGIEAQLCRAVASVGAGMGFRQAIYGPLPASAGATISALEALGAQKAQVFRLYEKTLGFDGW